MQKNAHHSLYNIDIAKGVSNMKMLTLEEYKEKLVETNKKVYELLADDSQENTVYVLHERGRNAGETNRFIGIFKKYESLHAIITDNTDFLHTCEWVDFCIKDYYWYVVQKYLLVDSEYQLVLDCNFDIDGNLLKYSIDDEELEIDVPLCKNVEKLFENGDIIKVNSLPLGEPYYGIYIYNKNDKKPHNILTYSCSCYCCFGIENLNQISKVKKCPEDKINILSENIKKEKGDYIKVFEVERINVSYLPF